MIYLTCVIRGQLDTVFSFKDEHKREQDFKIKYNMLKNRKNRRFQFKTRGKQEQAQKIGKNKKWTPWKRLNAVVKLKIGARPECSKTKAVAQPRKRIRIQKNHF